MPGAMIEIIRAICVTLLSAFVSQRMENVMRTDSTIETDVAARHTTVCPVCVIIFLIGFE